MTIAAAPTSVPWLIIVTVTVQCNSIALFPLLLSIYLYVYKYIWTSAATESNIQHVEMCLCLYVQWTKKEEDKNPINEGKACVSRSECWQSAPVGLIDTLLIVVWLCLLLPLVLLRFRLWFLLLMLMGLCPIASMVRTRLNPVMMMMMMTSGPNHCTVNG